MWILQKYLPVLCLASLGATKLAKQGWLDRLVAYHKKNFIEELSRLPTPLTVTVEKAPPGFVDSPQWDKEAVLRLVMIVEVLDAKPARQAIRRALSPSRRLYLPPGKNSFDLFPSWSKDHPNDFEYDDMVEYDDETTSAGPSTKAPELTDDTVVYISNPVEAHLPSARVTVRLLREIMEVRAAGLREMPTTSATTHSWKSRNTTKSSAQPDGSTTAADGSTAGADESTAAANGSTAAADGSTAGDGGTSSGGSSVDGGSTEASASPSGASEQSSDGSTTASSTSAAPK